MPWAAAASLSGPLQTPALPRCCPSSPLEILLRTGLEPPSLHLTLAAPLTLWKPAFHGGLCLRSPFRQAAHLLAAPVPLGGGLQSSLLLPPSIIHVSAFPLEVEVDRCVPTLYRGMQMD